MKSFGVLPASARGFARAVTSAEIKAAVDSEDVLYHQAHAALSAVLVPYWAKTASATAIVAALDNEHGAENVPFDHYAFRTLGVPGFNIASASKLFTDFGYERRDALSFPGKKLRAFWFAPPHPSLPRVFVSEIIVEELSESAQKVIAKYTAGKPAPAGYGPLLAGAGTPWRTPTAADYDVLAAESEYAAWVLAHGYSLNHTTISVHGLPGAPAIDDFNATLAKAGFRLSAAGGVTKVSPDGLLLQSSTIADFVPYVFACGATRLIPGAYIEFAERKPLPQFANLPADEITEEKRRDGFESSSADKIFESTDVGVKSAEN